MGNYQANPACRCGRCSTRGLTGPAVLVTLGVLFLLGNSTSISFDRSWPILLIVIGAIKLAGYLLPESAHWERGAVPPYAPSPLGQASPDSRAATPAASATGEEGEVRHD